MPKTTRKAPSFEGVAAGQTATARLPIGRTYEQLLIPYSGATLTQLNELRIIANGEVIHRVTELTKLDSMNQFEGRAAANGTGSTCEPALARNIPRWVLAFSMTR